MNTIARRFDRAATAYDQSATVQAQIADALVKRARPSFAPQDVLDIGCGTGFATAVIAGRWPGAAITALDSSSAMLREAQRKVPHLKPVTGDAAGVDLSQKFDLIVSSMALQWLPQPLAVLRRWRGWLRPGGRLCVALPVAGSFSEWRDACTGAGVNDGLWPLPPGDFAADVAHEVVLENRVISYASAAEFLRKLKAIGAATPDKNHRPLNVAAMRILLAGAPQPFNVTYHIAYLMISSEHGNI